MCDSSVLYPNKHIFSSYPWKTTTALSLHTIFAAACVCCNINYSFDSLSLVSRLLDLFFVLLVMFTCAFFQRGSAKEIAQTLYFLSNSHFSHPFLTAALSLSVLTHSMHPLFREDAVKLLRSTRMARAYSDGAYNSLDR